MRLAFKIFIIILATFFVIVAGILIFHDPIISYVLRRVITVQSQEKVRLELESFQLDFMTGRIRIEKPELYFDELYLGEAKNIRLKSLSHDLIEVDSLDLRQLIFDRNIQAVRLLMDKPVFDLVEQGRDTQSSFHPEKLITLLNTHPDLFGTMIFRVDEIVINYGSILLSEYVDSDKDPGLVDFTIIFEDFDSHPPDSTFDDRFLYSSEFKFILKNLKRKLSSGYLLNIDSAMYGSRRSDIVIRGVSLKPETLTTDENSIAITAGAVELHDIELEEIRGLEELSMRTVLVRDGRFVNYVNQKTESVQDTSASKNLDQLVNLIGDFTLDSLQISDVDYLQVHDLKDTLIDAEKLNFLLTGIAIDSSSFSDLLRNTGYQEISLSTGGFSIHKIIPDINLKYNKLEYSNVDRLLHISGLHVASVDTSSGRAVFDVEFPELLVGGLAFANFREEKKHNLTVTVQNPIGKIRLPDQNNRKSTSKSKGGKLQLSKYIDLEKLEINEGDFEVVRSGDFDVNVNGLNLLLEGFDLRRFEKDSIQYGNLALGYGNLGGYLSKQRMRVSSGPMRFEDSRFTVRNISLVSRQNDLGGRFDLGALTLTDFDLDRMVHENELSFGKIFIVSPVLRPIINIAEKTSENQEKKSFREITIPVSLFSDSISITRGRMDGTVTVKEEKISLSADYGLQLGGFSAYKDELLIDVINRITWEYSMRDINAHAAGHQVSLDRLVSDRYKSLFLLEGINIEADEAIAGRRLRIEKLDFPRIAVNGLDYGLIIREDSLSFTSLHIANPMMDVSLKKNHKETDTTGPPKQIDLREIVLFNYDTVTLTNLNGVIALYDDSSYTTFRIDSLNLGHQFSGKETANLINYSDFFVRSFVVEDTLKGSNLALHNGRLDAANQTLWIDELKGKSSNGARPAESGKTPGIQFSARDVLFKNILVRESLPSGLHIDKLSFDNLSLDVTESQRDEEKKTDLKVNLEIMNRFSRVMTRLSLDTTEIGGINVRLHTMDEAQSHTINIDSIGLFVEKILLDTSMINQEDPILIQNLTVDLKGKSRITKDSLYEMQTGRLHYNFPLRKITLDSFYVIPRFEDEEFFKRAVYQTDRIRLFGRKLEINNLYIEQVLNDDFLHCGSVDIHDLQADIYRDKRYPLKPGIYKKLPREQLMGLTSQIAIDSLHLINAFLKYAERDEKADEPGNIFIDNIQGAAYSLTNKLDPGERKNLKLDMHGMINGQSRMDVTVFFPLHKDSTAFWLTAKTETMDLTSLNSMTEHLLGIGILRGKGSVDAPLITGTDSVAKGELVFRYKKLKLAMYNRKKAQLNQGFLSPLINFLINDLVVKSNNPKFARKPRVGQSYFVRDTRKGVVNYLWKSVLSGLTSTLGFNNKEQRLEIKEERKGR